MGKPPRIPLTISACCRVRRNELQTIKPRSTFIARICSAVARACSRPSSDKARSRSPPQRTPLKERWLTGVPKHKQADLIPPGWFEAWADATFATDPVGAKKTPQVLRAPNGVVLDGREFWSSGKPLYDPSLIRVPTFLAHAEWDADLPSYMLYAFFEKLTNAPYKRYVQIGEGTHTVIMEKNRMQLFQAVQNFLDENFKPGE